MVTKKIWITLSDITFLKILFNFYYIIPFCLAIFVYSHIRQALAPMSYLVLSLINSET